ncbi:MAG TPA: condensation domain-containing protein [Pyrinomonadaceae bacterium]|nr:condensation domain-containing protein [Pyrinomonadaceae bacterium]
MLEGFKEPGTPLYNVNTVVRLQGWLDVAALERSFEFMVQRHETLRTTFELQDGRPVQVIKPHAPQGISLECGDLAPLWSSAERGSHVEQSGVKPPHSKEVREEIKHLLEEEALKPFDLASGPLLRLGDDDHVLSFTMAGR